MRAPGYRDLGDGYYSVFGYAFEADYAETAAADSARLRAVLERVDLERRSNPQYGKTVYTGKLPEPISDDFTPRDLALLCDGNLCFGASVAVAGNQFIVEVRID